VRVVSQVVMPLFNIIAAHGAVDPDETSCSGPGRRQGTGKAIAQVVDPAIVQATISSPMPGIAGPGIGAQVPLSVALQAVSPSRIRKG